MTISRYVLYDREGCASDHEYTSYDEAERAAMALDRAVVERVYEFKDTELVWTPDGSMVWPPEDGDDDE